MALYPLQLEILMEMNPIKMIKKRPMTNSTTLLKIVLILVLLLILVTARKYVNYGRKGPTFQEHVKVG